MHIHNCSRPVPLFKPVGFVRHVVRAMTEDHFSSKVLFFCLLYYVTKLTASFKYTYWGLFLLNSGKTTATSLHSYQIVDQEYIFLQGILERNVFEDEQNFPRDNFSLSAIISKLSAERSEARHSWWSRKGKSWPKESFVRPRKQFPFAVYPRGIHFLVLQGVVHHPSRNW